MERQIDKVYLLKDLSRLSGHSIHTVKFYLKRGLIQEAGRSPQTQFRYFNDTTVERLCAIRAWRKAGKGLAEIQQLLNGSRPRLEAEGSRPTPLLPASSLQPPASQLV